MSSRKKFTAPPATARADGDGGLQFTLKPGETVSVVSAVLSDLDALEFLAAARRRAATLQPKDLETLSAKHQKWWAEGETLELKP